MESIMGDMRDQQAVVLAGGAGTRLRPVISAVPKPMADIAGKPFLAYLLHYIRQTGIRRVVLSVGYLHEQIEQVFGNRYAGMDLIYAVEQTPLGTGGALAFAMGHVTSPHVLVCNGDTFFQADIARLYMAHCTEKQILTMALKPMEQISRYGTVTLDGTHIVRFNARQDVPKGLINGGVYWIDRPAFAAAVRLLNVHPPFSLEQDVLARLPEKTMTGIPDNGYFIDIGIPEDYATAIGQLPQLAVFKSFIKS